MRGTPQPSREQKQDWQSRAPAGPDSRSRCARPQGIVWCGHVRACLLRKMRSLRESFQLKQGLCLLAFLLFLPLQPRQVFAEPICLRALLPWALTGPWFRGRGAGGAVCSAGQGGRHVQEPFWPSPGRSQSSKGGDTLGIISGLQP